MLLQVVLYGRQKGNTSQPTLGRRLNIFMVFMYNTTEGFQIQFRVIATVVFVSLETKMLGVVQNAPVPFLEMEVRGVSS